MSDRPSDGMTLDELREEFDWIFEFQSRMAERIRGDADVHSLADYVGKLEAENAKLQDELEFANNECERAVLEFLDQQGQLEAENAKLRETLHRRTEHLKGMADMWVERGVENARLRELAAGIGHLLFALDVDYCAGCPRDDINHPCPVYTVNGGECLYETDLRDLGVEVNDG